MVILLVMVVMPRNGGLDLLNPLIDCWRQMAVIPGEEQISLAQQVPLPAQRLNDVPGGHDGFHLRAIAAPTPSPLGPRMDVPIPAAQDPP